MDGSIDLFSLRGRFPDAFLESPSIRPEFDNSRPSPMADCLNQRAKALACVYGLDEFPAYAVPLFQASLLLRPACEY